MVSDVKPTAPKQRTLGTLDLMLIWFGAATAITEIWAGGLPQLTGLGLALGLVAIVIGRLVGNGLMGAMARIGAGSGLPTMVLTRPAFGIRGSFLPALFNVLQLIGWTGWMLFVGFLYMDILAGYVNLPTAEQAPVMKWVWVILLGALCTLWALGGSRFWKVAQRTSAVLLFLLTIALTVIVLQQYDFTQLWQSGQGDVLGILSGADLVIAMSVSWLPLVADYSRYAKKQRSGALGTFWGYFIGGTWMYAVGLLVALATTTDSPDQMVIQVMGEQGLGWAVAAVVLVLISTVTTTFLDIFSTVVSVQNLWPRFPEKAGNIVIGALGIVTALFLDVFAYEPFLIAIGAIFLPAFTIVLADFYLVRRRQIYASEIDTHRGSYWYRGGFNWRALTAWLAGFLIFDWARGWSSIAYFADQAGVTLNVTPWPTGSSLPCIVGTAVVYLLLVAVFGSGARKR